MLREAFYSQARHLLHPRPLALYCLPLKERPHLEVVTRGVKVLLKRLLTAKCPITLIAFEDVSWRVEMLVESLVATKCSITILALEYVGWGVEMLLERLLATE